MTNYNETTNIKNNFYKQYLTALRTHSTGYESTIICITSQNT